MGPIGIGKTTAATELARNIKATRVEEQFEENIFLAKSYANSDFMFRSQLKFLLDNLWAGIDAKFKDGRWVRDTSVWSDAFVFVAWKTTCGKMSNGEYETYMQVFDYFQDIISKPDLLIALIPSGSLMENKTAKLRAGIKTRMASQPEVRSMEGEITDSDIELMIQSTQNGADYLRNNFGINVLTAEVDPEEIWKKGELRYSLIYAVRDKLGLLKEYLFKNPEEVADEIIGKIFPSTNGRVILVHSESMFGGKTSVLNHIAKKVGKENITAYQPETAIRYGEEQQNNIMDRDGGKTKANTIRSNKLSDVLSDIKNKVERGEISLETKRFIFIDEIMLFIASDSKEAITCLEELRRMGFLVVCTGIDYTYQETPFTFMHNLLIEVTERKSWDEFKMGTRCTFCDNEAKGTALYINGNLADAKDQNVFRAGDREYRPVCCDKHKSCSGQPKDFVRKELPV